MTSRPAESYPDTAIPPGEFLAEELEARGMTQKELSHRMGRPVQTINAIVNAKKAITAETAWQLEGALGLSAQFWMNIQTRYDLTRARLRIRKEAS